MTKSNALFATATFLAAHILLAVLWFDAVSGNAAILTGLLCMVAYGVWVASVHEAAHLAVAKVAGAQDMKLRVSGRGLGVTYRLHDSPVWLMAISLAGPLSGTAYGVFGLFIVGQWRDEHTLWATWTTIISILSCLQAVFLLPFAADGHMFWASAWNIILKKGRRL